MPMAIDRDIREMERLFERLLPTPEDRRAPRDWRPTVDIARLGDDLVVTADLPGIDPDKDLEVAIEDGVLRISGQRASVREEEHENLYVSERCFGSFQRDITLPEGVDAEAIEADYEAGVLTIKLPMPVAEEPQPRKIPVRTTVQATETVAPDDDTSEAN
jgi:HSP20 family protein